MIDGFLKFTNKAEAETVFALLGIGFSEDGVLPEIAEVSQHRLDIHVINGSGVIYRNTGMPVVIDDIETPVFEATEGYHVNVRYAGDALPEALAAFALTPDHPSCVWG
jgi:hypothetical protein